MSDCCSNDQEINCVRDSLCPICKSKANKVKLITLKSMLKPKVLEELDSNEDHFFCSNEKCDVIYFDAKNKSYVKSNVKIPVFQKENPDTVPICYCFDWTREKIMKCKELGEDTKPIEHIRRNIKENRCGCEVNNPQGSCCLGNVTSFIKGL